MQPVDADDASPKEPGIVFDRATQTDPYSQDTIDGVDMPSSGYIPEEKSKFTPGMAGGDDGMLDPDFGVVDPNKPTGEPDTGGDEGPPRKVRLRARPQYPTAFSGGQWEGPKLFDLILNAKKLEKT